MSEQKKERRGQAWPLSIAPMMDWTDRHYRYFMRQITRETLLYTEMITADAVIHGDREYLLGFSEVEHPIAIQLGGNEAEKLKLAAKIAEDWGYDEINLNVGCPSSRVQEATFGACLMAYPERVRDVVGAMREAVSVPVTVKHRIGIDGRESYEEMREFVDVVDTVGSDRFTVHARIAILGGLSPKQNREIPPLRYDDVYRLKRERESMWIEINGGIKTLDEVEVHLASVDGVMIGRAAYDDPYLFAEADRRIFGKESRVPSRAEVIEGMIPYLEAHVARGEPILRVTRHMLGLWKGEPGARHWRRILSDSQRRGEGPELLREAHEAVERIRSSSVEG